MVLFSILKKVTGKIRGTYSKTNKKPHGIKYSLTLHDKDNRRIVGYDNAHDCLPKRGRYRTKKVKWDHIHRRNKIYYYEFDCASQLISDFWETVDEFV